MAYEAPTTVDLSQKRMLRPHEAATLYGGSESYWQKAARNGDVPAFRLGKSGILFKPEDIEAFISGNPVDGPAECRDGRRNGLQPGRRKTVTA